MTARLTPVVTPVVARNMTRSELIRAAEHAFPAPSLLLELLLMHLRGELPACGGGDEHVQSTVPPTSGLHCPACGAQLQLTET